MDYQLQIENTVLRLWLVKSVDTKPADTWANCICIEKKSAYEWTREVETRMFKGLL